jgi:hypothetical protein
VGAECIFLIRNGELVLLEQHPYESETLLQEALASFPAVLAGSSTVDDLPASRLLLVWRAMSFLKAQGVRQVLAPHPCYLHDLVCATAHKTPGRMRVRLNLSGARTHAWSIR